MPRSVKPSSNNAPKCEWRREGFEGDGYHCQTLYVGNQRTRYFIRVATVLGHTTQGEKVGLFGAGMHPKGYALQLSCGPRTTEMKHRAEQFALA